MGNDNKNKFMLNDTKTINCALKLYTNKLTCLYQKSKQLEISRLCLLMKYKQTLKRSFDVFCNSSNKFFEFSSNNFISTLLVFDIKQVKRNR